jgi:hypothetical protein
MCTQGLVLLPSASCILHWASISVKIPVLCQPESFHFLLPGLSLVLGPRLGIGKFFQLPPHPSPQPSLSVLGEPGCIFPSP